jgi:hypothetical protein
MSDEIQMVSETEDSPPMPAEAWQALLQIRTLRTVMAYLDEQGVPQDHAMRAKAMREVLAAVSKTCERDSAEMKLQREALAETRH